MHKSISVKEKRLYISVSDICNLHCKHCFNKGGKVKGEILSFEEIVSLLKYAIENLGTEEVQLTGGEPSQMSNIFSLLDILQKEKIKVLFQTNGYFEKETTRKFFELDPSLLSFIISLDGIETHDFFRGRGVNEKVIENISILSKRFDIRINTLLSSRIKWEEIEEIMALARELDLTVSFNPVCPLGNALPDYLMERDRYFDWMHKLEDFRKEGLKIRKCFDLKDGKLFELEYCPVRRGTSFHIEADGSISPCGFLADNPLFYMGSVRKSPISELIQKIPKNCRDLSSECLVCDYYVNQNCHGGCPARSYGLYGKCDEIDYYCMAKYYSKKHSLEWEKSGKEIITH